MSNYKLSDETLGAMKLVYSMTLPSLMCLTGLGGSQLRDALAEGSSREDTEKIHRIFDAIAAIVSDDELSMEAIILAAKGLVNK